MGAEAEAVGAAPALPRASTWVRQVPVQVRAVLARVARQELVAGPLARQELVAVQQEPVGLARVARPELVAVQQGPVGLARVARQELAAGRRVSAYSRTVATTTTRFLRVTPRFTMGAIGVPTSMEFTTARCTTKAPSSMWWCLEWNASTDLKKVT